jgi:hypothetical protein
MIGRKVQDLSGEAPVRVWSALKNAMGMNARRSRQQFKSRQENKQANDLRMMLAGKEEA